MVKSIEIGILGIKEMIVKAEDTASYYGSGLIDVFATPAMIAFMENTAQLSIQSYLPEGMITLGTEVNIKHLKATPLGMKVSCDTKLITVDGKRLVFEVNARDEKGIIGSGLHTRVIVDKQNFINKLLQI
ncbi:MAG: thioesterase family protein [Bacteroidales bacterium]